MSFLPRRTAPSAEAAMSQTAAAPPLQSQDAPEMRREGPAETHIRGSQSIHQPTLPPSTRVHTRPSQRAPSLRRVPRITDSDIDTLLRESTAVTRNQVPPASVSPSPLTTRRYPADPIDEQDRPRPVPQATGDIETAWYARGDRPTSSSPHVRSPQRAPSLRRAPRVADPDSTPLRENTAGIHDHASPAVVLPLPNVTRPRPVSPVDDQDWSRPVPQPTGYSDVASRARDDGPTFTLPHAHSVQRTPSIPRVPTVPGPDSTPHREGVSYDYRLPDPTVVYPPPLAIPVQAAPGEAGRGAYEGRASRRFDIRPPTPEPPSPIIVPHVFLHNSTPRMHTTPVQLPPVPPLTPVRAAPGEAPWGAHEYGNATWYNPHPTPRPPMPIIMPPFIRSNSSPRMHAVYVQPPPASASTPTQVVYSGAPWNADGGGPGGKTVGERLQPTIDAAKAQLAKATRRAKIAGWILNTAIGLQVLIGALTTALGVALSGKNTSIPMAVLGGVSILIATYLARTRGSNEPEFSSLRAKALDHFVREAEAFKLDHGHEVGSEWDEKINDFRTDLEKILGKLLGNLSSTAAKGGVQPEDDSQKTGTQDPTMTVSLNGKYPVGTSATNTKLRLSLDNMPNGNQPGSVAIVAEAGTSPGDGNENTGSVDQTMTVSINGRPVGNIPREKRTSSSGSQRVTQYTAQYPLVPFPPL